MVTYDARPSAFTQLSTTTEWEALHTLMGKVSGIDLSTGSGMNPTLDTGGRNAVIADGNCVIKGQLWRCDAPVSTPIPAASASNRIDRLVIRLTRTATTSATVVQPVVITGTPSGSPVEPPLVQTPTGIFDIPVSSWLSTSAGGLTTLVDERQIAVDTWHDLRPGNSGWNGSVVGFYPPQYRMGPNQRVEVFGNIGLPPGAYGGINLFANPIPAPYRPNQTVWSVPVIQSNGSSNLITTPFVYVLVSGHMQFNAFPTGLSGTNVFMNFSYPIDESGLIQS